MRIGGVEVNGPNEEILVLPRLQGDIVIRARSVTDWGPFNAAFQSPKAPTKLVKGGFQEDKTSPRYREQMQQYESAWYAYLAVKSLEPSEIEWSEVSLDDPSTWTKWEAELLAAGLSVQEVNRIAVCVLQANSLDEMKLKQAREVFLRGQGVETPESSGPHTEPGTTQSGEPANASE